MFGGFKNPEKKKVGKYSGAERNFEAEMAFDEGDPDLYKEKYNNKSWKEQEKQEEYEKCWHESIFPRFKRGVNNQEELDKLNVLITSHSHMDIAWLWRMYQIVNKAKITLGKAAFHANNLPYYHFVVSQPIMIEWFRLKHPEIFEEFKKAISKNKIEIQGGMYVEPDGKVPSGESFCRQRLYGQRYYQEHFGKTAEIEWLTDSFGYNNNIPQFALKSGGKYFYTIKLTGNYYVEGAEWPFAHFKWRSPDGSSLISYSNNAQFRPLIRWKLFGHTRRLLKKGAIPECNYSTPQEEIDGKLGEVYPEVYCTIGVGDGGHGPQSEEVYRANHFVEKGYAKEWIGALDYFKKYHEVEDKLPIWDGAELYYNMHRGTLTTHTLVKQMNRYFEWNLAGLESLFALANFKNELVFTKKLHQEFELLWKDTLLLQFHDILPGSSCVEVFDDCYDIWIENKERLQNLKSKYFELLKTETGDVNIFTYVNSSDFSGSAPVSIDLPTHLKDKTNLQVQLTDGTIIPAQIYKANTIDEPLLKKEDSLVFISDVSAWSSLSGTITKNIEPTKSQIQLDETENEININTPHSKIRFNKKDGILLQYIENQKEIFTPENPGNEFKIFIDWSAIEPAWNIGASYEDMPYDEDMYEYKEIEIVENGPVFCLLKRELILKQDEDMIEDDEEIGPNSTLTQYIKIYSNIAGIHFDLHIDWHHKQTILKHYFNFTTESKQVIGEGPYTTEIYEPNPEKRTKMDKQRWEAASHCWTTFPSAENTWGVSYINNGKYGFNINNSRLGITVIRGPKYPDVNPNTYAFEERKQRGPDCVPTNTDQGQTTFNYVIVPYEGQWGESTIPKYSHFFNQEPKVKFGQKHLSTCGISVSSPNLELAMMKLPEDLKTDGNTELIIRIVETGREHTTSTILFGTDLQIKTIELVDILERNHCEDRGAFISIPLEIEKDGDCIISCTLKWNPHEIHTFKLSK